MNIELLKRLISSVFLIAILFYFIYQGTLFFNFFLSIIFILTLIEWHKMTFKRVYYLPGLFFLFFSFYSVYLIKINEADNLNFVLILLICISTDIGGYVFGKIFKGPKLTKFSPNKTYAGMTGGYLLSIISAIFLDNFNEEFQIKWFIIVILISTISQLGDIIISYFKRLSKIKDTGKIIPGHGGLLDRIDGMIFAFPSTYLIFKVIY